jgi:hypothetical protein
MAHVRSVSCFVLSLALAACGGGAADPTAVKPAEECAAYASALRTCFASTGAPTRGADELAASALTPRDEATRARMNTECAHDRVQLRAACK